MFFNCCNKIKCINTLFLVLIMFSTYSCKATNSSQQEIYPKIIQEIIKNKIEKKEPRTKVYLGGFSSIGLPTEKYMKRNNKNFDPSAGGGASSIAHIHLFTLPIVQLPLTLYIHAMVALDFMPKIGPWLATHFGYGWHFQLNKLGLKLGGLISKSPKINTLDDKKEIIESELDAAVVLQADWQFNDFKVFVIYAASFMHYDKIMIGISKQLI